MSEKLDKLPAVFHVNWFRQDADDRFLWPGFGDNIRVLRWIVERCEGRDNAVESPIGLLPADDSIDVNGLDIDADNDGGADHIDKVQWQEEMESIGEYFETFGDRLPEALREELIGSASISLQRPGQFGAAAGGLRPTSSQSLQIK